ncbi:hypothetical protein BS78_09G254800 [Paspalum vaginatum]|nr:hypothetical protein BS78_09G254800 [Paspalum vaginatum]
MAADELLGRVCGAVAACTRRISRATRRLLRHRGRVGVGASSEGSGQRNRQQAHLQAVVAAALCARGAAKIDKRGGGEAAPALWSRRILMGERCQPLDFAGAIHYDSFGRRLARPPTPRSASSSHLSCGSFGSASVAAASDDTSSSC